MKEIKRLYDLIRNHEYRFTGDKVALKKYMKLIVELAHEVSNYLIHGEGRNSDYYKLWSAVQHDHYHELSSMKRCADFDREDFGKYHTERIIMLEGFIQFVHSMIENRKVEFVYNLYTNTDRCILSRYAIDRGGIAKSVHNLIKT